MESVEAEQIKRSLRGRADEEMSTAAVLRDYLTVGELKARVDHEVRRLFVENYLLAAIMFGLFFLARRAPRCAMATALCVYLAALVVNAMIDPTAILQEWLIRILFLGALIVGVKVVVAERPAPAT